jgi:hypothetical protein
MQNDDSKGLDFETFKKKILSLKSVDSKVSALRMLKTLFDEEIEELQRDMSYNDILNRLYVIHKLAKSKSSSVNTSFCKCDIEIQENTLKRIESDIAEKQRHISELVHTDSVLRDL